MIQKPKLIIITGLPATGKTRLAKVISDSLQIPLFSKDSIKVPILKQLGVRDRSWDINVGITAVNLQMILAMELLNNFT